MFKKEQNVVFKRDVVENRQGIYLCDSDEIQVDGRACVYLRGVMKVIPVHFLEKV